MWASNNRRWTRHDFQPPQHIDRFKKRFIIGSAVAVSAVAIIVTFTSGQSSGSSLDTTSTAYTDGYAAEPQSEQYGSVLDIQMFCTGVVTDPNNWTSNPYNGRDGHTREEWAHGCLDQARKTHPGDFSQQAWEK
jgi:hypothetical protein